MNLNAKKIVFLALFIALEVILTRFLSIQTPIVRIGFTFLPIALSAIMFGPWFAGIAAAIADVIGFILFPYGAFFPGFTLSAFLTGAVYGLFLHKKPVNFWSITTPTLIVCLLIHLVLDTIWLWILMGKGVYGLLPPRIYKALIMIPIQIITIQVVYKYLAAKFITRFSLN